MNAIKIIIILLTITILSLGSVIVLMSPTVMHMEGSLEIQTIEEIVKKSDYGIIGTVLKITPVRVAMELENDPDRIYTDITLQVDEDLFGNYDQKIIDFRILGGETKDFRLIAEQSGKYEIGEKILVFLGANDKGYTFSGHNYLINQGQSAFKITEDGMIIDKYQGKSFSKDLVIEESKQIKGIK